MKSWPVLGISFITCILFLAHWFIYSTAIAFGIISNHQLASSLKIALIPLALLFVVSALLSYRFSAWPVRTLYKFASVWLGLLNYLFFAACLIWMTWETATLAVHHELHPVIRTIVAAFWFGLAIVLTVGGMANAYFIRTRRISIKLENLPGTWRGRTALVISDIHLGHINEARFARRIAAIALKLRPDIVLIPGDVFDGSKVDHEKLIAPLRVLNPPHGIYFATGNHDEFGDARRCLSALRNAGVRILNDEKVEVDGLQIAGVAYRSTTFPMRFRVIMQELKIDPGRASILLNHVPNRLPITEETGVSLQISGHTHGGQFIPYTWLTQRIFGKFTHGLHRFGALQVLTSYGAGTWGPPMRLGTTPEVVLITFE